MSGVVFDTSIYIAAFRLRRADLLDASRYGGGPLYLSTVVAQELYVGAATRAKRQDMDRLWRRFQQVKRLLVLTPGDWREAGLVLSQIGVEVGYEQVRQGRLTNDALLAVSARRAGVTIITLNAADFALLARYRPVRFAVIDPVLGLKGPAG